MPFSRLSKLSFPSEPVVLLTVDTSVATPFLSIVSLTRSNSAPERALEGSSWACLKTLISHGFVIEEDEAALSKISIWNVLSSNAIKASPA